MELEKRNAILHSAVGTNVLQYEILAGLMDSFASKSEYREIMSEVPNINVNPLRIAVGLLVVSYLIGEFIIPKYPLIYPINLFF